MSNTIKKNQTAEVKTKSGSNYSYKYVDIAQIHDYLQENNMSYYQYIDRIDNDDYIMTVKIIDGKEQPPLRGSRVVDATLFGNDNPAQKQGSALTYARRYSLLMAFGLATEDDDGASLTEVKEPTLDDANKWTFQFGKYKGQTMNEILDEDEQYVEWFINNKANDFDKKCYELLTGEILPTEEQLKERTKLSAQISKLMIDKKVLPNEISEHFGKSSKEMSDEDLEEVIKWLEAK